MPKKKSMLQSLYDQGFDESTHEFDGYEHSWRVGCSQCEALCVNGIACHETGCPNTVADDKEGRQ